MSIKNKLIIVRGGGDLATGVIQKLYRAGFKLIVTETAFPSSIRRAVSLSEAVYDSRSSVEGVECVRVNSPAEFEAAWSKNQVPLMVDPECNISKVLKADFLVDAIIAKKNTGTVKDMAAYTIALGPGFKAPRDVDVVIETNRGHNLGRLIFDGEAQPNTGVPGDIKGVSKDRVIYSPFDGVIKNIAKIGDFVGASSVIASIGENSVKTDITGVLRGIIRDGYTVKKGLKIADIDPRKEETGNCFTISDKARALGGAVLEAVIMNI